MVKKNTDFDDIIHNGWNIKSKYYNIYYKDGNFKFGIAVSKKIGNAVVRNKVKRRLRMILDNNKKMFKNSYNYIIIVKKGIESITYQEMEIELIKALNYERKRK